MKLYYLFSGLIFATLPALSVAQNQPASSSAAAQDSASQAPSDSGNSLAAAAKNTKDQKAAHAKKVFTDEDMDTMTGPFPRMALNGPDNSDDVIAAVLKYKSAHTPEQTETAMHDWFDRYDQILQATIKGNRDVSSIRNINNMNSNDLCQESQDYQQCQSARMADMRGMRNDQYAMISNTTLMMRIQQSFFKVRGGLTQNNLRYPWFKIRLNSIPESFQ